MDNQKKLSFPCIRVRQPMGEFFIASINSDDLCDITKVDVRRLVGEKGFETYLGIQRPRSEKRVNELVRYIGTPDACFPTAVILAIPGKCAEFDEKEMMMTLSNYIDDEDSRKNIDYDQIANVLDGQHRIEGLKKAEFKGDFDINVSIFVDIDNADQAYIFSTVNLTQTKVNKSLTYDLFDLANKRSPQKTCHNIAVALDKTEKSPFFERVKRLGVSTKGRFNETITQATFVESLLKYLSKDAVHDRSAYLRGVKLKPFNADELKEIIFGNMFREERDIEIADIVWNYFDAVQQRWPQAWSSNTGQGLILNKTNGFKALMRFMRPAYLFLTVPGQVPSTNEFKAIFDKIDMRDSDFNTDTFKPGSSGEGKLYQTLLEKSKIK